MPLLRINGRLMAVESPPLDPDQLREMILKVLEPWQQARLDERMAVDIGYGVKGLTRFRANIYRQRGTLAASFRRIPFKIKDIDLLVGRTRFPARWVVRFGGILVNGDGDMGSFSVARRLLLTDQQSGVTRDLLAEGRA